MRVYGAAEEEPIVIPPTIRLLDSYRPAGTVREAYSRQGASLNMAQSPTSGRLLIVAVAYIAGDVVTSIKWRSSTQAAVTPANQWSVLLDSAGAPLRFSADDTNTAWAATTVKTFTLTTPYTILTTGLYFHALMVAAATPPSLTSTGGGGLFDVTPSLNAIDNVNTGLTTPASFVAANATFSATLTNTPYTWSV